jgi:hypothetical protein
MGQTTIVLGTPAKHIPSYISDQDVGLDPVNYVFGSQNAIKEIVSKDSLDNVMYTTKCYHRNATKPWEVSEIEVV